jgi:hemerythrin-like domain-containing protein
MDGMPIQIGQTEPGCDDPVGLMMACHRRIERFLQTLRFAARQCGGRPLSEEERDAVKRSLLYFREAAPNHAADEEEDLFPALLSELPDVAVRVERLETEHKRAQALHAHVDRLGERWVREGHLNEEELASFREATEELEALYTEHIHVEEDEVFPHASSALGAEQLEAIGRRMAARRGVAYPESRSK